MGPPMKAVPFEPGNFTHPQDLPRQVDALARAADRAFRALPNVFMSAFTPVRPNQTSYSARLGDLVFADATAATRTVVLPQAPPGVASLLGIVATNNGVNTVDVVSVGGNVNGVVSFSLPTVNRLYLFVSDSIGNWWGCGG